MNKKTLIIVLFILAFVGMVSFIHYEMERSRGKNVQETVNIIKEDSQETVQKTTDKIPEVVQETGEAMKNVISRQANTTKQPVKEVSPADVSASKKTTLQAENSTPPVKDNSPFKSPVGTIFDIGKNVINEADKTAQEFLPPITSEEEKQIGAEINKMILAKSPEWKDSALVKKATSVFNRLLLLSSRKDISYKLIVIDDRKTINAYAAPGGYIYLTRALLERFSSEAAIAMCLGHEIGHQELRHTIDRLRVMMAARKIAGSDVAMIAQFGYQMLTNCYTKEQEFAADDYGFRMSLKIGIPGADAIFL